jgi:hypothetical protein
MISSSLRKPFWPRCGCLVLALLLLVAVYWSGLAGPFLFDDQIGLVNNRWIQIHSLAPPELWQAALSRDSALGRPLSMVSFAVNHALSGLQPWPYKFTNLLIHLLNTVLVAVFAYLLLARTPGLDIRRRVVIPARDWRESSHRDVKLDARLRGHDDKTIGNRSSAESAFWVSACAALIWALGPLQVSTVLYVIQRMTLLSAAFTLLSLIAYTVGRLRIDESHRSGWWWIAAALLVLLPAAALSKENGVLVVAFLWLLEVFALRKSDVERHNASTGLAWLYFLACFAGALYLFVLRASDYTGAFEAKGFSAVQRLLTEPRVLWWYVQATWWPRLSEMALVHDTWQVSKGLWDPPATAAAIAAWVGVIVSAALLRTRAPWWGFCWGWFLLGHSLEAGPLALELAFEHRNYLPSLGLVLLPVVLISAFTPPPAPSHRGRGSTAGGEERSPPLVGGDRGGVQLTMLSSVGWRKVLLAVAALAIIAALASLTAQRSYEWRSAETLARADQERHPDSVAAAINMANTYRHMALDEHAAGQRAAHGAAADEGFARAMLLNPQIANPIYGRIRLRYDLGLPVPDELLAAFVSAMSVSPLPATSFNAAIGMIQCALERRCAIPEPWVARVLQTAMSNPAFHAGWRAQLLVAVANYYGLVRNDPARAAELARQAADNPGAAITTHLHLARWLADAGELREALQELDRFDGLDTSRKYAAHSNKLRNSVAARLRTVEESAGGLSTEPPSR